MTDADLAELERLCEAATPGPWEAVEGDLFKEYFQVIDAPTGCGIIDRDNHGCGTDPQPDYIFFSPENARFIAAARTALPALLAEVQRMKAALEDIAGETGTPYARMANEGLGQ